MKTKKFYIQLLIPTLLAFLLSVFYISVIPHDIRSDALEYDKLADSILVGEFSIDGKPSMEREPGYPFFRADIKVVTSNSRAIIWIQALLYALIVFIIGLAGRKIDSRLGVWSAWGAGLSYGLAFYPSVHLSETLTAFLLSLIGLILLYAIEKPTLKNWVLLSMLSSMLMLTRYTYVLIPVASILVLSFASKKNGVNIKKIITHACISLSIIFVCVAPWVVRNYITFGEINVAGRSGAILYAKALKADTPWRSIPDSFLSIFLGRGILFTVYPNNQSVWLEQWGDWWRGKSKVKEMWGDGVAEIDQKRKEAAFNIIFKDTNTMAKFAVWSGIDELRLLALPNPIPEALGASIEGTYGPIAKDGTISPIQLFILAVAHIVQFLWFIGIFVSLYLGFRKYTYRFIPGIFLICIFAPHAIADNIARYGAPLQPWLLSGIFMTILFPLYIKIKERIQLKRLA